MGLSLFKRGPLAALAVLMLIGCGPDPMSVSDGAGLFDPEQADRIATFHRYLLADHDIDYRVETIARAVDLNRYASEQFGARQVGSASRGGRGLLLVLDTTGNRVRLEVSRALEGVYPDAFVAYIEQRQMTPFFAAGRIADGILATTELIVTRAQHATANQGWDDEAWSQASTAGAGATAGARLDEGKTPESSRGKVSAQWYATADDYSAGDSPESVLQTYLHAMSTRNASPDLRIYTAATREMLLGWVVTPAQMDGVVRTYRGCHAEAARYDAGHSLAVIRYPIDERACSPWFFQRGQEGWKLDLTAMQQYIRFGRDNSWHFDRHVLGTHPYRFAFGDWGFDNRGYAQKMRWNLTVASDAQGNVWVERAGAGSAAEDFGFRANDRLLRWDGVPVHHHEQVIRAMRAAAAGAAVSVDIERNGQPMRLEGPAPPAP